MTWGQKDRKEGQSFWYIICIILHRAGQPVCDYYTTSFLCTLISDIILTLTLCSAYWQLYVHCTLAGYTAQPKQSQFFGAEYQILPHRLVNPRPKMYWARYRRLDKPNPLQPGCSCTQISMQTRNIHTMAHTQLGRTMFSLSLQAMTKVIMTTTILHIQKEKSAYSFYSLRYLSTSIKELPKTNSLDYILQYLLMTLQQTFN